MAQYTVKKGDSPWSIAKANGISLKELSALNNHMDNGAVAEHGGEPNANWDKSDIHAKLHIQGLHAVGRGEFRAAAENGCGKRAEKRRGFQIFRAGSAGFDD